MSDSYTAYIIFFINAVRLVSYLGISKIFPTFVSKGKVKVQ